jgi:serine/threonine protein kinase
MESPTRKRSSKNSTDRNVKYKVKDTFLPSKYVFFHKVFQNENSVDDYYNLNEYNIIRFFGDIDIFNFTLLKYINISTEFIYAKCDLGSVYIFNNIVVKIKPIEYYDKFIKIKNISSKYIEEIIEIVQCQKSLIIISTKYQNIQSNIQSKKLKDDIYKALEEFDKNNLSHKDVSLDNIVYDNINNNYVLIDFDMVSNEYKKHIFRKSFKDL